MFDYHNIRWIIMAPQMCPPTPFALPNARCHMSSFQDLWVGIESDANSSFLILNYATSTLSLPLILPQLHWEIVARLIRELQ